MGVADRIHLADAAAATARKIAKAAMHRVNPGTGRFSQPMKNGAWGGESFIAV
jgi:hypothetical protein